MSGGMLISALCLIGLAVLHSYLGERHLVGPLLRSPDFPRLAIGEQFAKGTLRFAWHLTSLAWLAIAYMLLRGELSTWAVVIMMALSAIAAHAFTRGRHAAWAVFAVGALAVAASGSELALWSRWAGLSGAVLLAAMGGMHVAWAFGLRLGTGTAVPSLDGKPLFVPPFALTLLVALGLFAAAWLLLGLAHFAPAPLPEPWLGYASAACALVFALRTVGDLRFVGMFKRVQGTSFARQDDLLFTPLCFALSAVWVLQLV